MERFAEVCELMHVHEDIIERVAGVMPPEDELFDLADFFRVFGDTTRIKILYVLGQSEMCVCDIAGLLGMGQSAISHQLRVLKQMRLVKYRKDGKAVFYALADAHIESILAQGMEHIRE
ncbi:MAG: metalloregulator ArsR/SmtB family transcription factor [Lachnospiraceae bacterium]|jgi:ArsR family transcriptional regulator|nr:metalloregulator ArsR/SmtB family transcription factor [Lachnospiraceae bacterium]